MPAVLERLRKRKHDEHVKQGGANDKHVEVITDSVAGLRLIHEGVLIVSEGDQVGAKLSLSTSMQSSWILTYPFLNGKSLGNQHVVHI